MRNEYTGNISTVRAVEDVIRATRKYTESLGTMRQTHPVQGGEFPSRMFCKYYEVYPKTVVSWDMPMGVAIDWLWGDVPCVNVTFRYDYRVNKAEVILPGATEIGELAEGIPGFKAALDCVIACGKENAGDNRSSSNPNTRTSKETVPAGPDLGMAHRAGSGLIPRPQPVVDPAAHNV
jgi:hypothetical protein